MTIKEKKNNENNLANLCQKFHNFIESSSDHTVTELYFDLKYLYNPLFLSEIQYTKNVCMYNVYRYEKSSMYERYPEVIVHCLGLSVAGLR